MKRKIKWFSVILILIFSCCVFGACNSNITLTILFDSNGGTECNSIVYKIGKSFNMPEDPTRENYIFDGWYSDNLEWQNEFTINTILNYPLSKSTEITVYAKWIEQAKLVFESNGGSQCESIYINNSNISLPTPTLEGYIFKGWYVDNTTFQNKYEVGNQVELVNNEIILYAKWEKVIKKTIYYQSSEFTLEKEYDIITNNEEIELYKPNIIGYVFVGWYYDENLENPAPYKISHSMIDTYNNAINLYAKFTEKEIHKISLVGEVKTSYEYGEEFDSNGAKIKIEYVDKNFDDEIVNITKDMVTSFFTVDNEGYRFQTTENGIKDEAYISIKDQTIKFEYCVNSDITSFSLINTNEFVFVHGGNTDFRNRNIKISWVDKNNNTGETRLAEFADYTINYQVQKKTENSNIFGSYYLQSNLLPLPGQIIYKVNYLDVSNYGTFTALLRYHFKTIEVEYTVLPNENISGGKYVNYIFKGDNKSLQTKNAVLWLYDVDTNEYIDWKNYDNAFVIKDLDTSVAGPQKAVVCYNGKDIEIDYYVIDTNNIVSARFNVEVKQNDNKNGYTIDFTLSDGYVFSEYIKVEHLIGFNNNEIGTFVCEYVYNSKKVPIEYTVVANNLG